MRLLFFALIFMSVAFASCREEKIQEPYKTGMEGKPLPEFAIQLLDSVSYLHFKDIPDGKKLIVFYYSPTCPYCRAQMRDMINNIETFKDKQLYILTDADLRSIRKFVDYFKLEKFKNVIVGRDTGGVVLIKYRLTRVPFTAFFDESKDLKIAYSGRMESDILLQFH